MCFGHLEVCDLFPLRLSLADSYLQILLLMLATTTWSIPVWFRGYFYELVSEINPRLLLMVISPTAIQPAHWRQVHFRPEKALPLDATHRGRRMTSRLPFPRTIVDF